jgi:putative membrane protein
MKEPLFKKFIYTLSVVIPLVVVLLFKVELKGYDTSFLPPIYATTNGLTAILLLFALWAVKSGKIQLHENIIKICLGFSLLFLVLYVVRHMTSTDIIYGDANFDGQLSDEERANAGSLRSIYLFILLSHIALSVVVIPLVLWSFMRGVLGQVALHKKIVRYAFPIWWYVSATGAIVYLMIAPYYPPM